MKPFGHVSLVGAGPGDPELLTIRALRRILDADALVYDRLVSPDIVGLARTGTQMFPVGKRAGCHPVPQSKINDLLVDLAARGLDVVRLKGGDPLIFGRGSEEADALRRVGIPFEIIPGITAAQGMAASTGVPLTHRGLATGVRYVTGHRKANEPLELDWKSLADPETTLVVYMGAGNIAEIARNLVAEGLSPDCPVLAVSKATTRDETRLASTLGRIGQDARVHELPSPVLFMIGQVVGLMDLHREILPEAVARQAQQADKVHA